MSLSNPKDIAEFRSLIDNLPNGWQVSKRVLDPVLMIQRRDGLFILRLFGRRRMRGQESFLPALSNYHNWVREGDIVRPLPHDIATAVAATTGDIDHEKVAFKDVIRLLRIQDPAIQILADDDVFTPARSEADILVEMAPVPGLNATLFPYQARGVQWMSDTIEHTGGLILADEMGLGKTIQIISLLLLREPNEKSPALIICTTSLIANWRSEIFQFAPKLSVLIHRGPHRAGLSSGLQRAQVVITTYDTLANDLPIFIGVEWSWLVCDEAQAIKNPDSNRRKAVAAVPRLRAIPMTGTPVETSLLNLWSLADIAIPGLLGGQTSFEESFPDDVDSAMALAHMTDPIVLRRRVADVAGDLPERIDIDVPLELGERLAEQYIQVKTETLEKYPVAGALVATGQLQIFCAHPWLRGTSDDIDSENVDLVRRSKASLFTPKIERTVALLEEAFLTGKKVLIFAIFNRCGDIIREAGSSLPSAYWGAINGATPQEDRQKIVDEFSMHNGPGCLVLNPKAAGAGLNIVAATVVIHYTQAWNPALELQASARAHRRGQTLPVTVYRLFYEDTVECVMIDRAEWRKQLGNEAVPVSTRDDTDLRKALSLEPGRSYD